MTIAQAREAAKQVRESLQRLEKLFPSIREGKSNFTIMVDFILDHFPEDGEERASMDWLVDVWGFKWYESGHLFHRNIGGWWGREYDDVVWWYHPSSEGMKITTRRQARQLFQALRIRQSNDPA